MKTQHKLECKRLTFNYKSLMRHYSNKTNENELTANNEQPLKAVFAQEFFYRESVAHKLL